MRKICLIVLMLIGLMLFVSSFTPQDDIDLRDVYAIYNATNITAEYFIGDISSATGFINDNSSWNQSLADTLYRADSWNNLTGIPHSTPSNGDTTHFSLSDEIYDFVIGLNYLVSGDIVGLVGNWSDDKSDYSTTSQANTLYRSQSWDNFTGIPTATPSNGDTTHLSTANHIYDWVTGLGYITSITNIFDQSLNTSDSPTFADVTANSFTGSMNWTNLQNYPVACPGSSAVTELGDSVTCSDLWVDTNGDTWTGSMDAGGNNLSNVGMIEVDDLISETIHQVSDDGLILDMNFNSENIFSNSILDSSNKKNHGTNKNATYHSDSGFNHQGSFEFDAYQNINLNQLVNITSTCFWAKPTDSSQMNFLAKSNNIFGIRSAGYWSIYNGTSWTSTTADILLNQWQQVCYIYNESRSGYDLYLNNEYYSNIPSNILDIQSISANHATNAVHGSIDNLKIYDRSLSQDEVSSLYFQRIEGASFDKNYPYIIFANDGTGNYNCNITEDCSTKINAAIDFLSSSGGKLYFKVGTYSVGSSILVDQRGIVLEGEMLGGNRAGDTGQSTLIKALDTFDNTTSLIKIVGTRDEVVNLYLDGQNTTLNGIEITGGASANTIRNVHCHNNTQDGLYINYSVDSDQVFRDLTTTWNGRHGMMSQRHDIRIYNYYSHRNWNGAALMLSPAGSSQVVGMHSFYNKYGIYLNGSNNMNFNNVVLEQNSVAGLYFDSSYKYVSRVTITSATFYANDCPDVTCTYDNNNPHIYINAENNNVEDITLIGSTFDSTTHVFNYSESGGGIIDNFMFTNNIYQGGLGDYDNGIRITSAMENSGYLTFLNLALEKLTIGYTETTNFILQRISGDNEALNMSVDDEGVIFRSIQDETTSGSGNYGGFNFIMDDDITDEHTAVFDISMSSAETTPIMRVDKYGNMSVAESMTVGTDIYAEDVYVDRLKTANSEPIQMASSSGQYAHFAQRYSDNNTYIYSGEYANQPTILNLQGWNGTAWTLKLKLDGDNDRMTTNGNFVQSETQNRPSRLQRYASDAEQMQMSINDYGVIFRSTQDETSGSGRYGGFKFIMDNKTTGVSSAEFLIESVDGSDILSLTEDKGLVLGDGTNQKNITMTSPDGTEYSCGVANGGAFTCS